MNPNGTPTNLIPWKPGQSGNPSGKAKAIADMEHKAREHGDKAIKTLAAGLDDDDARVRMSAATALLDRGFGKPAQAITGGTDPDDLPIREEKLVRYVGPIPGNPVSGET
jgi:hypothetical protein